MRVNIAHIATRERNLYLNSECFQLQTALQKSRTTYIQIKRLEA